MANSRQRNSLLLALLVLGSMVSSWQAIRATLAEARAKEANGLAEERFQLAKQAVDKYLNEVTETPELKNANLHELRKKLLQTAIPFYQQLAEQSAGDSEGKATRAGAYLRLGQIHNDLSEHVAAIADFEQARDIFA